jgi:hypothetical protein
MAMAAVVPVIALMEALYYLGGLTGTRDETPLRAVAVTTAVGAIAAFAVWRFGARAYAGGRGAGAMAVLAALFVLRFWIGITFPVATAAVLFGRRALATGARGVGRVAVGAGVVALAVAAVLCALGAS